MTDDECVALLKWLLPRLHLRWPGYRRVRRQVCRRVQRRLTTLGLDGAQVYGDYLRRHPEELVAVDYLCRVTISRFCRDERVFRYLGDHVLPELGARALERGATGLRAWSVGCASGEEPYSLALVWNLVVADRLPGLDLRVLGTDIDEILLERAKQACYKASSLRELPDEWLAGAFEPTASGYRLKPTIADCVHFEKHDVRESPPGGRFDLALCRNLAFTYYDEQLQRATAARLHDSLRDGGALLLGRHESLPEGVTGFKAWSVSCGVYRRLANAVPESRRPCRDD